MVSDLTGGKGKPTSGPNKHVPGGNFRTPNLPHTSMYRGNPVYHASAGARFKDNGVTIFYVNAQGTDGKIIGIGSHTSDTSYAMDWHVKDWHVPRELTLS